MSPRMRHDAAATSRSLAVALIGVVLLFGAPVAATAGQYYCRDRTESGPVGAGGVSGPFRIDGCTFTNTFKFGDILLQHAAIDIRNSVFTGGFTFDAVMITNVSITLRNTSIVTSGTNAYSFAFVNSMTTGRDFVFDAVNTTFLAYGANTAVALRFYAEWYNATVSLVGVTVGAYAPTATVAGIGTPHNGSHVVAHNCTFEAKHVGAFPSMGSSRVDAFSFGGMSDSNMALSRVRIIAHSTSHAHQRITAFEASGVVVGGNITVSDNSVISATILGAPSGHTEVLAAALYFGAPVTNGSVISVSNSSVTAMCPFISSAFTFLDNIGNATLVFRQGTLQAGPSMFESKCLAATEYAVNLNATITDVQFVGCATAKWTPASRVINADVYARCNSNNGDTGNTWQANTFGAGAGSRVTLVPCGQCQARLDCYEPNTIAVSPQLSPFDCQCTCNISRLPPPPERRVRGFDQRCYIVPRPYDPALSMTPTPTRTGGSATAPGNTASAVASQSLHRDSRSATLPPSSSHTRSAATVSTSSSRTAQTPTVSQHRGSSETRHATSRTASESLTRQPPMVNVTVVSNREIPSGAVTNASNATIFARTAIVETVSDDPTWPVRPTAAAVTSPGLVVTSRYVFAANGSASSAWDVARAAAADRARLAVVAAVLSARAIAVEVRPTVFASVADARAVLRDGRDRLVLRLVFDRTIAFAPVPRAANAVEIAIVPSFPNVTVAPTPPPNGAPLDEPTTETRSSSPLDIVAFAAICVMAVLARPAPALALLRHRFLMFHRHSGGSDAPVYRGPRTFPDAIVLDGELSVSGSADAFATAAAVYNTALMLGCMLAAALVAGVVVAVRKQKAGSSTSGGGEDLAKAEEALLNDDDDGHAAARDGLSAEDAAIAAEARRLAAESGRLRVSLGTARFVPAVLAALTIFFQPTIAAAFLLLIGGLDGQARLLGAIIAAVAVVPVAILLYFSVVGSRFAARFVRTFQRSASGASATSELHHRQSVPAVLNLFAQRDGTWQNLSARRSARVLDDGTAEDERLENDNDSGGGPAIRGAGFIECYGAVFGPFRADRQWFLAVEVGATVVYALASAIADRTETPVAGAVIILLGGIGMTAATVALRPCRQTADQVLLVAAEVALLVAAGAYVAAVANPANRAARAVCDGFVGAVQGCAVLRAVFDIVNVAVARAYDVDGAILRAAERREAELASASHGQALVDVDGGSEGDAATATGRRVPQAMARASAAPPRLSIGSDPFGGSTQTATGRAPGPTPDMRGNAAAQAAGFDEAAANEPEDLPLPPQTQTARTATTSPQAKRASRPSTAAASPANDPFADPFSAAGADAGPSFDPLADVLDDPPGSPASRRPGSSAVPGQSPAARLSDDDEL